MLDPCVLITLSVRARSGTSGDRLLLLAGGSLRPDGAVLTGAQGGEF